MAVNGLLKFMSLGLEPTTGDQLFPPSLVSWTGASRFVYRTMFGSMGLIANPAAWPVTCTRSQVAPESVLRYVVISLESVPAYMMFGLVRDIRICTNSPAIRSETSSH